MERIIDPLTTMDAKLWADEFMATKARLGDKEFDHAMMLAWFSNAIMVGYDEGQRRKVTDAQATIAALQARVKELEEITKVICGHCCEPMEIPSKAVLQSALTQVQGLVRDMKDWVEGCTYECERCGFTEPMTNLDIYYMVKQATLPATPQERQE